MDEILAVPPLDSKEDLIGRIAECVTVQDDRTLQAYILEQRLAEPGQFWELTTLLGPSLTAEIQHDHPHFFTTARRCLAHFARCGNAKEMLLALLEQVEGFRDDVLYVAILPCLQDVLQQLPVKRGRSLELAMDTLGAHITGIPAPHNWMLEGEETKLLETDETVRRYLNVVPAFLDFMQPFLVAGEGVAGGDSGTLGNTFGNHKEPSPAKSNREWEIRVLKKHLLSLLKHPLVLLDLRYNSKEGCPKTYSREIAEQILEGLQHVETNFCRLLLETRERQKSPTKKESDAVDPSSTGDSTHKESNSGDGEKNDADEMAAENAKNECRASGEVEGTVEETGMEEVPELAAACLAYLVQVEGVGLGRWPFVYTHPFLLHAMLPFVRRLLTQVAHTAVYKGLALLSFRLSLILDSSLPADSLDDPDLMGGVLDLIHVMTRCPIRELRQAGLSTFRLVFLKIDVHGRYQLMRSVLMSCKHAGVKSVVIGMVKDQVDADLTLLCLQPEAACTVGLKQHPIDPSSARRLKENSICKPVSGFEESSSHAVSPAEKVLGDDWSDESAKKDLESVFLGRRLEQLVRLAAKLPDGAASDLLEESDVVMATLNLLRYLVLRDPRELDRTGVWGMMGWIESEYLAALRTGLDMSVGHYRLELHNMMKTTQGGKRNDSMSSGITASLSVAGRELPSMSHDQQMRVMNSALTTFDMMNCVLARVCELIDTKQKMT